MGILSWLRGNPAGGAGKSRTGSVRDLQAETQQAHKLWRRALRSGSASRVRKTARQLRKLKREARGF